MDVPVAGEPHVVLIGGKESFFIYFDYTAGF